MCSQPLVCAIVAGGLVFAVACTNKATDADASGGAGDASPPTRDDSGTETDADSAREDAAGGEADGAALSDAAVPDDADAAEPGDATGGPCTDAALAELEATLRDELDRAVSDPEVSSVSDVTLLLATDDGRRFEYSHGSSTPTTAYESASTSKLVAAVVMLDLVDRGFLMLDTTAHALIPFWEEEAVTLRHLLSFTSGFSDEPLCINFPNFDFEDCVQNLYTRNQDAAAEPGTEFYYASTHLQVAGLMAIKATGKASWQAIFEDFKARSGLFADAEFDLPSVTNPRLAGGMHWTAEEYLAFLMALKRGTLLSDTMRAELFRNQRGAAQVVYSPTLAHGVSEDWAYGLGNWLECETAPAANTYNCGEGHRNSSAGAYGAYPFLDFDHDYVGIVARQGALGTYPEGVQLFRRVRTLVEAWVDRRCP